MNKYFKEVVTLKSLDFKVGSGDIPDSWVQKVLEEPELRAQVKNVCTPIPLAMNAKLEQITNILGIPKGRFLSLAIASAIEEAQALMDEIDITEYMEEEAERAQQQDEAA